MTFCQQCGKELVKYEKERPAKFRVRRFCNVECSRTYNANILNQTMNERGRTPWNKTSEQPIDKKCEYCDKQLIMRDGEVYSKFKIRRFCDITCSRAFNVKIMNKKADENGRNPWNKGKIGIKYNTIENEDNYTQMPCAACDKPKTILKSYAVKHERVFCDNKCKGVWTSKNRSGKNHPQFGTIGPNKGNIMSQEQKDKISASLIGNEQPKGKDSPHYGTHHSQETKDKMRESHLGKTLSDEHCENISISKIGENNPQYGKPSWNLGISPAPETIEKIREARLNQKTPNPMSIPERFIGSTLWMHSIPNKYDQKGILGRPDFIIFNPKIAIFIDGDFWHARPDEYDATDKIMSKTAQEVWDRDRYVTEELTKQGYKIIRIWEKDIKKDPYQCYLNYIKSHLGISSE